MSDIHELSATEVGALIARGELSPVECAEHFLRRIESMSATVGVFVSWDAERHVIDVAH